jgi:hypothetical protein
MNKNPCCVSVGPIYRCGFIHVNKEGKKSLCPYALCPKHFRTSVLGTILADLLLPTTQGVQEQGSAWLLSSVFLFFANVFYTPFLKTALMILACNPYFQCLFPTCWGANMDQTFVLAVYLSIAVVLFFGVGFPLSITLLLQRRSTMLREIFFAPEYESRFGDAETREVDEHEWARFVNVDNTALGTLYKSFEFKWLYVPPIILAWKVILLSPPVFLENGSLGQAIGVAVVEFSFGLFMFITAPSTNALVDWMYKLGCVHQMLFLGLHNVHVYLTYHHRGDLEGYMIATTIVYLVVTLLVVVHAKLEPTIKALLEVRTLSNILTKLGMQYTEKTGIFVTPSAEIEFFELDEDEDEPAMVEAVDDEVSDHHDQCTVQYLDAQQPESSSREPGNGSYANQHEMQQVDLETDV